MSTRRQECFLHSRQAAMREQYSSIRVPCRAPLLRIIQQRKTLVNGSGFQPVAALAGGPHHRHELFQPGVILGAKIQQTGFSE